MAEWLLQAEVGEHAEVASAGCCPSGYVHPLAIKAMAELGYDLSAAESKNQNLFDDRDVATVITVCSNAESQCPGFPGQKAQFHWPFDDPADATGSDEERLAVFRRVRDEIQAKMKEWSGKLLETSAV